MREVLLDRAVNGRVGGVGEQAKRVPEAERGLQRAGVAVQPPCVCVREPAPRPESAEVAAAPAPQPGSPLAEVEVPERVVDPGRFPVNDAGQLALIG
jgi:hypothetical protein